MNEFWIMEPWQIRAARRALRWSVDDLAGQIGVSSQTIRRAEKNIVKTSAETIWRIKEIFNENGIAFPSKNSIRMKLDSDEA